MQKQNLKAQTDVRKRAYKYSRRIVNFLDLLPNDMTGSVIAKQLMRSATSIGANLVESKGASSKKEFGQFFTYSLRSANETLYWLGLLRDAKKIELQELKWLIQEGQELARIIGASLLTIKGKRNRSQFLTD
ncbi:MAG: four helix bundle protein [Phycisphaerae bacterium]|nr:four helix bundle protein [Phycisphaerae bacterium]